MGRDKDLRMDRFGLKNGSIRTVFQRYRRGAEKNSIFLDHFLSKKAVACEAPQEQVVEHRPRPNAAKIGSKLGFGTLISLHVVLRAPVVEIAGADRFGFLFDHLELYEKSCTVPGLMMI